MVITHLNGCASDNRPSNLAYRSQKENIADKWKHGTMLCGDKSRMAKITDEQALKIIERCAAGESRRSIAVEYGIAKTTVQAIVSGRIRKHLREGHALH
jgi:DNA invertase Pin-like site-specific DNA recombinase